MKCYYVYESGSELISEDKAFATGCVELMFNLEGVQWETKENNQFVATPKTELWGQIIQPLAFRTPGKNRMFGIRLYPYAASVFLNENISLFNNKVTDLSGIIGQPVQELHNRLLDAESTRQQIELVESFLLKRVSQFTAKLEKVTLVQKVMSEMKQESFFDNIANVAAKYGITSRYLQKIFINYTGLTPKLYGKINRFQNSLVLLAKQNSSLTSVAYECGYFDQSHFIREFKSFTGVAPSAFSIEHSSAILASPNK